MAETDNKEATEVAISEQPADQSTSTEIVVMNAEDLRKESLALINKIIAETDVERSKDLTYLFNINQNKKTMIRQNKLNDLYDTMVDEELRRMRTHADEMSNEQLMAGLKTVHDLIERSQKQITGVAEETPLITINQQNNEVNIGDKPADGGLSRESRDKVKNAIMEILKAAGNTQNLSDVENVIDATASTELKENDGDD